ncbi:unnamed protein product [Rotaria sp. Silwood1]|nr:unnamed protein product [Rotaria sp. Silwood1]CAF3329212.1 unnamed protein product [Rotaria sp. Silwood1]CAF3356717.1 unnamed protein product [Rotaria sp. Silwood1]CAF4553236.1 unnamed protein product [Rotaria sp. Silwood1]CAF4579167.1 unnamed protein product [Rotaria sp. Silwood1]
MPSSVCSSSTSCYSYTSSTFNDLANIGKIIGIVLGSILGLAILICIIAIIFCTFCKRKHQVQLWSNPSQRPPSYGQSIPIYPYTNYPQEFMASPKLDSQKIEEEPPPAYEEISTIENLTERL